MTLAAAVDRFLATGCQCEDEKRAWGVRVQTLHDEADAMPFGDDRVSRRRVAEDLDKQGPPRCAACLALAEARKVDDLRPRVSVDDEDVWLHFEAAGKSASVRVEKLIPEQAPRGIIGSCIRAWADRVRAAHETSASPDSAAVAPCGSGEAATPSPAPTPVGSASLPSLADGGGAGSLSDALARFRETADDALAATMPGTLPRERVQTLVTAGRELAAWATQSRAQTLAALAIHCDGCPEDTR